jgi:beta-galactosidase
LQSPPQLCLWRAQTDNDASVGLDGRFEKSGLFRLDVERTHIREESGATLVERTLRGAFGDAITHRTRIRVLGTHDYLLDEYVRLPDGPVDVLRVGVQFSLAAGIDHVDWTGLGPWENYPDRRASALLGRWSATIDELATPYVRPQDNGTRGGVDELALRGVAGRVDITAGQPLWMTASRHSTDALERTAHWWELPPSDLTHITLDVAHRGVGTGALGPDTLPQHRITESEHEWQWRLRLQTS